MNNVHGERQEIRVGRPTAVLEVTDPTPVPDVSTNWEVQQTYTRGASRNYTGVVELDGGVKGAFDNKTKLCNDLTVVVKLDAALRRLGSMNRTAALLIGLALLPAAPLTAGSVSAPLTVSVTVIGRAIVTVDNQPFVEITAADVQRGYVDLMTPVLLHGRTNSRRGYMLQVEKTSEEFSTIELSLADARMNVSSHESWIQRPYVPGGELLQVTARLFLSPAATVGTHALPMSFSASAL